MLFRKSGCFFGTDSSSSYVLPRYGVARQAKARRRALLQVPLIAALISSAVKFRACRAEPPAAQAGVSFDSALATRLRLRRTCALSLSRARVADHRIPKCDSLDGRIQSIGVGSRAGCDPKVENRHVSPQDAPTIGCHRLKRAGCDPRVENRLCVAAMTPP